MRVGSNKIIILKDKILTNLELDLGFFCLKKNPNPILILTQKNCSIKPSAIPDL